MKQPDAVQATFYGNGPLPHFIAGRAYLTAGEREFALSPEDSLAYLRWCREQHINVTGFEIWGPTIPGPTVLVGAGAEGDIDLCESVIPQCIAEYGSDIVLNIWTTGSHSNGTENA